MNLPNPYLDADFDGVQDPDALAVPAELGAAPGLPESPSTTSETMTFLEAEHADGGLEWLRLCLAIQRTARGLPAIHPSAASALNAIPRAARITNRGQVTRGMVAFFDTEPWGHVVGVRFGPADRTGVADAWSWTNDAKRSGGIDTVPLDWFPEHWGAPFQCATTQLNGYELDLPGRPARPRPGRENLIDALLAALADLNTADAIAERRDFPHREAQIEADIERIRYRVEQLHKARRAEQKRQAARRKRGLLRRRK